MRTKDLRRMLVNLKERAEWGRFKLAVGLYRFEDAGRGNGRKPDGSAWLAHYTLQLFGLWLTLWPTDSPVKDDMHDGWSISYDFEFRCFHLSWGHRTKIVHTPWSMDHWRTFIMIGDDTTDPVWVPFERYSKTVSGFPVTNEYPAGYYHMDAVPFRYDCANGDTQKTTATLVKAERMQWRWRLFKWLRIPFAAKTRYSVDISFAEEMGSERGSWKGGVVGTGFTLNPGIGPYLSFVEYESRCSREHSFCR